MDLECGNLEPAAGAVLEIDLSCFLRGGGLVGNQGHGKCNAG